MGMRPAVAPRGAVVTRIRIKRPTPTTRHGLPGPKLMARVGDEFPLACLTCGGDSGDCELGHGLRRCEKNATEGGAGRFEKPVPDAKTGRPMALRQASAVRGGS